MKIRLISVAIPCYNEVETINEFYRRVTGVAASMPDRRFEFVFVNDGSTDGTDVILNELAANDSRVKVLHLARNRGHQIALTAGIDHASGDMIVTIDADLQDPPELIKEMLKKIEEGYDVVHAQRKQRKGETWFKLASAKLFYRLLRWFSSTQIIEECGDFRAFTRPVLEAMTAFRMPHRFLRGMFVHVGFNQCVIQYDRDSRYAGETKYPFFKMLNLSIDAILGFSPVPIRMILWLSVFLWGTSLVYLIRALIYHFFFNLTVTGWTSIIVLMFFFTGLTLFSMAITGAYIGRIFQQGQNQPLYWLADVRNIELEKIGERATELREIKLSQRILKQQNASDDKGD